MLRKMFFKRSESKERKIVCSLSQSLLNKTTHDTATPPYIVSTCTQMWARVSGLPLYSVSHGVRNFASVYCLYFARNPLHPNIIMHILHTVLHTFL